ncbi:heparinase [Fulvivirga sp. M361]|nr:heparinase [Fulvivirga sp. M361]
MLIQTTASAQDVPADEIIRIEKLADYLKDDVKHQVAERGKVSAEALASYFREKFSERFFYDYQTFDHRFATYNETYGNQDNHRKRALDHMGKYADSTQWVLPFNYLNGNEVNAYALRHLARQHKMVDIAFLYFNDKKDPKYIRYFENQLRSLNHAFRKGQYEKIEDGNGVYEAFRSGYRILNWLWIHNMFLNEPEYSDKDQLQTIATLLQHGAHLYERNAGFRAGNHQTKGMSSLAMLAILLRDFKGTDLWFSRAMERLEEHLLKEINEDGFQFERSVHYHMSDINNYFYVFQLAKISGTEVSKVWEAKLRSLFTTLAKIAYPDKTAPVLQDDTDIPWGEKNEIAGAMTLGYLLFEDPTLGYFAEDRVAGRMYWFLQKRQLNLLKDIDRKKPAYGSLQFPDTHYYIMREGWNRNDKMMIISAGLDSKKPDHQHGDMLGIQAIANGHAILPNYQVRYSLKDFELFKNSMVKNVALVDDELQGKQWTSNKGGSGFGKFRELPAPKPLVWQSNDDFDLFVGSHDGFKNLGVSYTRQVIFVKDDYWIVKDNFQADTPHVYKQIWQGHYTVEQGPDLIRASFEDASGCDIYQLNPTDHVSSSGARGKQWTIVSKEKEHNFSFVTIIFPYKGYNNRIDETIAGPMLGGWKINQSEWKIAGKNPTSLTKDNKTYFFNVNEISLGPISVRPDKLTDLHIELEDGQLKVTLLGDTPVTVNTSGTDPERKNYKITPGDQFISRLKK